MVGHLKIVWLKEVEPAGARSWKVTSGNYAEYPLIVLSRDGKREIGRVTADRDGNYRLALPAGDYILDVAGRAPGPKSLRLRKRILDATARKRMSANII